MAGCKYGADIFKVVTAWAAPNSSEIEAAVLDSEVFGDAFTPSILAAGMNSSLYRGRWYLTVCSQLNPSSVNVDAHDHDGAMKTFADFVLSSSTLQPLEIHRRPACMSFSHRPARYAPSLSSEGSVSDILLISLAIPPIAGKVSGGNVMNLLEYSVTHFRHRSLISLWSI